MNSPQSIQRPYDYQQQTMCPLPPLSKGIGNVNSISQRMDPFSFQSTSRYVSPQMAFSPQTTSTRSTTASPQSLSSQNTTFDFHSMSDPLHTFGGEVLERINAKPGAIYGQLYDESLMVDPMWNPLAYPLPSTNGSLSPSLGIYSQSRPPLPGFVLPPDLLGNSGSPFLGCENVQTTINNSGSINPDWLKPGFETHAEADGSPEYPGSPLLSISPASSCSVEAFPKHLKRMRSQSESIFAAPTAGRGKHTRRATCSTVTLDMSDKVREELEELDQACPASRRDRRRLQNRLAQRAFRARSKITNAESVKEMINLQYLTETQTQQLEKLSTLVERLQRENTSLKTGKWAEMQRLSSIGDVKVEVDVD